MGSNSTLHKAKNEKNNEQKVNVTVAISIVRAFFRKVRNKSRYILKRIRSHIEAKRPGRKDTRKQIKPKSFIPFLYRVA